MSARDAQGRVFIVTVAVFGRRRHTFIARVVSSSARTTCNIGTTTQRHETSKSARIDRDVTHRRTNARTTPTMSTALRRCASTMRSALSRPASTRALATRGAPTARGRTMASTSSANASVSTCAHVTLVQGARMGQGLELARQMLERDGEIFSGRAEGGVVVATCRDPSRAEGLDALAAKHGARLRVLRVDATDEESIIAAAKTVAEEYGRLDFMANVSAVLSTESMRPETSIARCEAENMMLAYRTNAVGPTMMMKHFSPLMLKTAGAYASEGKSGTPVIANWSARVSSIGDNGLGGWHSYRASKTALNQLTRNAAIEFARKKTPIVAMCVHPGTVDTKLSEPFKKNVPPEKLFTSEYSIRRLLEVIGSATVEEHSGNLYDYAGEKIHW